MTIVWAIIGAFGLNLGLGLGSRQKYTAPGGGSPGVNSELPGTMITGF